MIVRAVTVGLFAVLTTVQVVRTAAVEYWAPQDPATVAVLWPGHPDVQRSFVMGEVGSAAATGNEPSRATLLRLKDLATSAPLATEPFLVQGAIALRSGDHERPEQLLAAARDRDPRSTAARFLLSDLYLRAGRLEPGLSELAVFSRFVPGATAQVAPALAQYATTPGTLPQLKRILALYPEIEPALLDHLATDTRNVDLIMGLASPRDPAEPVPGWQQVLLSKLVEEGAYERALGVWARLSRLPASAGRGLFNPQFAEGKEPPPFNWSFASGSEGVAEPSGNGLHILYYGRGDLVLANQLMVLPPGRYRLSMNVVGQTGNASNIVWFVACLPSKREVMVLPIGEGQGRRSVTGEFQVSGVGCDAQRLELKGLSEEFAKTADFQITDLRLARSGS